MADRVVVGRLVVNDGEKRRVIGPGMRINPDQYGMSAEEVKHYEERGILREPRDEVIKEAPRRQSKARGTVERRSPAAVRVVSEHARPVETRHTTRTEDQ